MAEREQNPLRGVLWMVATGACFVALTATVKAAGTRVPAAESAFLRYALALPILIPAAGAILRAHLTRRQLTLFALRGLAHTGGVILWFYAMTRIAIAEVTALNYLNPVYVSLGAAFLFREGLPLRRLLTVIAAFTGALIILRPGLREIDPGHVAMLGTALCLAASYLIAKVVSDEVSATVVVGMLQATVTVGLLPFALAVWVTPTLGELGFYALAALFATLGHTFMTFAFASAPLTVTQPVTFLQLVWAATLGAVAFGEPVDGWVVLGGLIIVAAISLLTWREARLRRRERLLAAGVGV
ncbi:DMT family transporter [Wenxinia marina]|uniref:EamA-like transporter family n=1 Tax=Wenxinia marina DSM 24838 TaxID=1123501 RepID=A0A0D0NK73_9RHOB|nr:DMT family transporter [Wenxinia marina]KIQ68695.1 EamA-like transporter family [Wenxinia marina DSM 24838]GGL67982.1 peptide ABC transporter permease [Wenxinia marina]